MRDAIELARAKAATEGSIAPGDVHIAGVCLCLSGCDSPADVARTEGWIAEDLPELKVCEAQRTRALEDARLRGAFGRASSVFGDIGRSYACACTR